MPVPDALRLVLPFLEAMRHGVYLGLDPRPDSEETLVLLVDGVEATDAFATASEGAAAAPVAAARAAAAARGRGRAAARCTTSPDDPLQTLADSVAALRREVQEIRGTGANAAASAGASDMKGGGRGSDAYRRALDQARGMLPAAQPHLTQGVTEGATTNSGRRAADAA